MELDRYLCAESEEEEKKYVELGKMLIVCFKMWNDGSCQLTAAHLLS